MLPKAEGEMKASPEDAWESSWTEELDRRVAAEEPTEAWSDVRERLFRCTSAR